MNDTSEFKQELCTLIEKYNMEMGSNTPAYILANHIVRSMKAFDMTIRERANDRGESL